MSMFSHLWAALGHDGRVAVASGAIVSVVTIGVTCAVSAYSERLKRLREVRRERRKACMDLALALRRFGAFLESPMDHDDPTITGFGWTHTDLTEAERIRNTPDRIVQPYREAITAVDQLFLLHEHHDLVEVLERSRFAWSKTKDRFVQAGLDGRLSSLEYRDCIQTASEFVRAVGKRRPLYWWLVTRSARLETHHSRFAGLMRKLRERTRGSFCLHCAHRHRPVAGIA